MSELRDAIGFVLDAQEYSSMSKVEFALYVLRKLHEPATLTGLMNATNNKMYFYADLHARDGEYFDLSENEKDEAVSGPEARALIDGLMEAMRQKNEIK